MKVLDEEHAREMTVAAFRRILNSESESGDTVYKMPLNSLIFLTLFPLLLPHPPQRVSVEEEQVQIGSGSLSTLSLYSDKTSKIVRKLSAADE